MSVRYSLYATVLGLTILCGSTHAVINGQLPDSTAFTSSTSEWNGVNVDYVYRGAVAIAPRYLIGVRHTGVTGLPSGVSVVSTYTPPIDPGQTAPPDLKIYKVNADLPGYYSLYTGTLSADQNTVIVGHGYTGTAHDTYVTENTASTQIKRWGTNQVSDPNVRVDIASDWSSSTFGMAYLAGDTAYECVYGNGDSGGATFVKDGGVWKLAGVNESRDTNGTAGQWNYSYAVSIPAYQTWINSVVPEPTSLSLLLLAGPLALRRRRAA